jgi:hypothetical protein
MSIPLRLLQSSMFSFALLMVILSLILHDIIILLGALSILLSLVQSQFVSAPTSVHYSHILRVLRYLQGTITRLFFPHSSSLQLQAYSNATWASDPSDCHSLSAYCVFLSGSLIA